MAMSKNDALVYEYLVVCQQNDLKELTIKKKMAEQWNCDAPSDEVFVSHLLNSVGDLERRMQNRSSQIRRYQEKRDV